MFTSLTASTWSNLLLRCRTATRAIGLSRTAAFDHCWSGGVERALSLHRAGETGDVVFDEERVDHRDWDRTEQRTGHQRAPIEHVAAHQLGSDSDGDSLLVGGRQEHESVDELVPG